MRDKYLSWLLAFILYKPAAATVYAAAFWLIGEGKDLMSIFTGMVAFCMAVVALPALMRLITPAVSAVTSGGSGMAAAGVSAGGQLASGAMQLAQQAKPSGGGGDSGTGGGAPTGSGSAPTPAQPAPGAGGGASPSGGAPSGGAAAGGARRRSWSGRRRRRLQAALPPAPARLGRPRRVRAPRVPQLRRGRSGPVWWRRRPVWTRARARCARSAAAPRPAPPARASDENEDGDGD